MNRSLHQASTPIPAPMDAHAFLKQALTELPEDMVASRSKGAELAISQVAATDSQAPQMTQMRQYENQVNSMHALPQNREQVLPAVVTGEPIGNEKFLKEFLPNAYTAGEKADIAGLQSRLPVVQR